MKSKVLLFSILISLTNCTENKKSEVNFDSNLQKIILNYQNKVPIPDEEWIRKNTPIIDPKYSKYCYIISFRKQKQDTILQVQLINNGIFESKEYYGVYESNKLKPTLINDENNLSHNLVTKLKNIDLENFVVKDGPINDTMYPFEEYFVKGRKLIFIESYEGNME